MEPLLVVRRALREQIVILHRRLLAIVRDDEVDGRLEKRTSARARRMSANDGVDDARSGIGVP